MPGELRAVLFDLDGTLVDTEGLWWQAYAEVSTRLGGPATDADAEYVYGRAIEHAAEHLLRRLRDVPSADGPYRPAVDDPMGGPYEPRDAEGGRDERERVTALLTDAYAERVSRGFPVLPGAVELLDALAAEDIAAALVTSSPRWITDKVLRRLGPRRFRVTVTADDVPRRKPAPEPYLLAMAGLGLGPETCVASEDSPTGAASATAAGCAVLVVGHGGLERWDPPLLREFLADH